MIVYFRQIYYEMRHQKMMTWVSISGTALSIFLVMVFFMTDQVKTVEVAPESRRQSIYIGQNMHLQGGSWGDSSGSLHYDTAKKLYDGLDGVELVSFMSQWADNADVNMKGEESINLAQKWVDDMFWKIYDFRFVDGKPFDQADVASGSNKVVITRSVARSIFGEDHVAGREVLINMMPHVVCGVVEDVNPLLNTTFSNIYRVFTKEIGASGNDNWFGNTQAALLPKAGVTYEQLKSEIKSRYATLSNMKDDLEGAEVIYHEQPYSAAEVAEGEYGSNNSPNLESKRRFSYFIYAVMILLPAINLSSMTRSRLRHRVSEIGVRRAFGARRLSIMGQMIGENLIISLMGGLIGLVLSIVFVLTASNLFFQYNGGLSVNSLDIVNARPTFEMLFTWKNFFVALVLCFILNLLSATVPAWQASRVTPAEAIAKVK